jgi:hypothetical protein
MMTQGAPESSINLHQGVPSGDRQDPIDCIDDRSLAQASGCEPPKYFLSAYPKFLKYKSQSPHGMYMLYISLCATGEF